MNGLVRGLVAAVLVPMMLVEQGYGWGALGHGMIDRLAAANLPKDVPEFLRSPAAQDAMAFYAPEPDRWLSNAEPELKAFASPDHFLNTEDADMIGGPLPRKRYDFIRALSVAQKAHPEMALTAEGVGLLPYATDEDFERLKGVMREYRLLVTNHQETKPIEAEIVFLAGVLGHFVGDGSQPLHATRKYNGWLGDNPNGYTTEHRIHSQFETEFVKTNVNAQKDLAPLVEAAKPRVIDDVFDEDVKYLKHSESLVEQTYQFEKSGALTGTGTAASRAFVNERLAAGAIELRDIIYTAWVKSADPLPAYQNSKKVVPATPAK